MTVVPSTTLATMRRLATLLTGLSLVGLAPVPGEGQGAPNFLSPPGLPPANNYSQLVDVPPGNRLLFISGQVPLDAEGNLVGGADFAAQARQVFLNLRQALAASGARFQDVVKLTFYVIDAKQIQTLRQVRNEFIDTRHPPASTLVEVRALFREDVQLEVDAIAAIRP